MKERLKVECLIDDLEAPLFECGSGHFTQGYSSFVGVPAPKYLEDDPWFGPAVLSEPQMTLKKHMNMQYLMVNYCMKMIQ